MSEVKLGVGRSYLVRGQAVKEERGARTLPYVAPRTLFKKLLFMGHCTSLGHLIVGMKQTTQENWPRIKARSRAIYGKSSIRVHRVDGLDISPFSVDLYVLGDLCHSLLVDRWWIASCHLGTDLRKSGFSESPCDQWIELYTMPRKNQNKTRVFPR